MISFTSVLHPAVWATISALLNPYFLLMGCQKEEITKEKESEHKYAQIESKYSMNMEKVNQHIASTNFMILTDVHTKKTVIIHKGKVVEAFPIVIGVPHQTRNVAKTSTHLGLFTVHAIDYCPPWPGATGLDRAEKMIPCGSKNRLGAVAFWYRANEKGELFVFGFHGRHPGDQDEFDRMAEELDKTENTEGCVAAPHEILRRVTKENIFTDPGFLLPLEKGQKKRELHDAVKKLSPLLKPVLTPEDIAEYSKQEHKNVFMAIIDFKGKHPEPEAKSIPTYIGPPIPIDIKILNIDTRTENIENPLSPAEKQKYKPLMELLTHEQYPNQTNEYKPPSPRFLVTDCLVTKTIQISSTPDESSDQNQNFYQLSPGDKLMGVYKHSLLPPDPIPVKYWDKPSQKKQTGWVKRIGWVKDLSGLRCNSDVDENLISDSCAQTSSEEYKHKSYWSYKETAALFKCSEAYQ